VSVPSSSLILPFGMRDPAFQERIWAIKRAKDAGLPIERWDFLRVPLVAVGTFEVYTHCPRGHVAEHLCAGSDRPGYVARRCQVCDNSWLVRRS
jgi:hypothetical protein